MDRIDRIEQEIKLLTNDIVRLKRMLDEIKKMPTNSNIIGKYKIENKASASDGQKTTMSSSTHSNATKDFKYIHRADGIEIQSYIGFGGTKIVIPSQIDSKDVVSIGKEAFKNCKMTEIVLPNTLKSIEDCAFQSCKLLSEIILPPHLEKIGVECFEYSGLESVVIPNSIRIISRRCFRGCKNLSKILLSEQLVEIEMGAFTGCYNLKHLDFPKSLKKIHQYSVEHTGITCYDIPETVNEFRFGSLLEKDRRGESLVFVIRGMNTVIADFTIWSHTVTFYCKSGSLAQDYARKSGNITIRPLSEWKH